MLRFFFVWFFDGSSEAVDYFFPQVSKSDVEAALKVLNFAIYHKELTEMEDREQERERELERKRKAEHDGHNNESAGLSRRSKTRSAHGDQTTTEEYATTTIFFTFLHVCWYHMIFKHDND